ncbi:MAG: stage II sporulation protein M [Oscillospiraceae bacterium]|jgi:hypothetical protein|nr:stage II sporulation protein M [Oscillospiraceae bacterium]
MEQKIVSAQSVALGILALAFLGGIVAGSLVQGVEGSADYLTAAEFGSQPPVLRVLADTVLYPVVCFLLGLTVPGVLLIPMVVGFRGFLVSYTVASCVSAFGSLDGILLSLSLLAPPLLLCLPCLFCLGAGSLLNSRSLFIAAVRRTKASALERHALPRFAVALLVTSGAAAAEWLLCPVLAALAAARIH